jgi:hypothetical protein
MRVDGIPSVEVLDLPGIYELGLHTPEAKIVRDVLSGADRPHRPDAVIVIVDAANLARNLVLVGEALAQGLKPIVALNMVDVAKRRGWTIDAGSRLRRQRRWCRWSRQEAQASTVESALAGFRIAGRRFPEIGKRRPTSLWTLAPNCKSVEKRHICPLAELPRPPGGGLFTERLTA